MVNSRGDGKVCEYTRSLRKVFQVRLKGRNKPEIVQDGRAQFAGEPVNHLDRFFHHSLCIPYLLIQSHITERSGGFQCRQMDINPSQHLSDLIMEFSTDLLSLLFLV